MRVMILGAERLGRVLALELLHTGHEVRLLEQRAELLAALPSEFDGRAVCGSPLHRATLEDAVAGCDAVAAASSDDCLNAVVTLAARHELHVPLAVAVIGNPRGAEALAGRGAAVICPTTRTARDIRLALDRSGIEREFEFGDELAIYRADAPPRLAGRTLADLALPGELTPLAVERVGRVIVATPALEIASGDALHILAGSHEAVADLMRP